MRKGDGGITLRANIAPRNNDLSVVPGEVLYKGDRFYFDRRNNPPEIQDLEKLHCQPCAHCQMGPYICQKPRTLGWVHTELQIEFS